MCGLTSKVQYLSTNVVSMQIKKWSQAFFVYNFVKVHASFSK